MLELKNLIEALLNLMFFGLVISRGFQFIFNASNNLIIVHMLMMTISWLSTITLNHI